MNEQIMELKILVGEIHRWATASSVFGFPFHKAATSEGIRSALEVAIDQRRERGEALVKLRAAIDRAAKLAREL